MRLLPLVLTLATAYQIFNNVHANSTNDTIVMLYRPSIRPSPNQNASLLCLGLHLNSRIPIHYNKLHNGMTSYGSDDHKHTHSTHARSRNKSLDTRAKNVQSM